MKREFVQAIFCAPTGAYEDKPYPSRLTDDVFKALAEAGINRMFGFGYDGRKETIEKTFELCEKYGIFYFPTPASAEDYVRILQGKNGEKPFNELTEAEKKEQQILRREYIEAFKQNLRGQLNNISIKEKDGSITNLGEKYGQKKGN